MIKPRISRGGATALVLAGLAAFLVIVVSAQSGSRAIEPPTAAELAKIRAHALREAALNGDPNPADASYVATTRKRINAADGSGTEVSSDEEVYAVLLRGNFVAHGASRPSGAPPPRGQYLVVVYDAETLDVTDFILGDRPMRLSEVGTPHPLAE